MKIIAIEDSKLRKGYLHLVIMQNNKLLGVLKYQPAGTRGAEFEVISFLAEMGKVPKKYLTGYERPDNVDITIVDTKWVIENAIEKGVPTYY